jgi:hypothetical protein
MLEVEEKAYCLVNLRIPIYLLVKNPPCENSDYKRN